jgi:hypothetical protein
MHLGLVGRPFVPQIGIVPSFISRGTPHHTARETSISEGRKLNIRILPAAHNEPHPKVGTWDRLFDFPSEGRHAEDFHIRKVRRLRPGLNPRTRETEASMLTTRPPKPLTSFLCKSSAQFYVHVRHLYSLLTASLTLHVQHRAAAAWPVAVKLRIVLRCGLNYSNAKTRGSS